MDAVQGEALPQKLFKDPKYVTALAFWAIYRTSGRDWRDG